MLGVLLQDLPVDFRPLSAPDSLFPRHQTALNIRRQLPDDLEVEFIVLFQITVGAFDLQIFGCRLSDIQRDVVIADEVGKNQRPAGFRRHDADGLSSRNVSAVHDHIHLLFSVKLFQALGRPHHIHIEKVCENICLEPLYTGPLQRHRRIPVQ